MIQEKEPARRALVATLRRYELRDTPQIVDIVAREVPLLPNYKGISVHRERVEFLLLNNQRNSVYHCNVLVDGSEVVGLVVAYCSPTIFSFDTIAIDNFLWIAQAYRSLRSVGELIRGYKEWAHARGAVITAASFTGGIKPELMDMLLRRHGFTRIGALYHLRAV